MKQTFSDLFPINFFQFERSQNNSRRKPQRRRDGFDDERYSDAGKIKIYFHLILIEYSIVNTVLYSNFQTGSN
jgi:hypothetical protein